MTTLILRQARLLDLDHDGSMGDVVVADGRIVAVGPGAGAAHVPAETESVEIVDLGGDILIPGLVNSHTHSNQSIEKGLCDALPLDAWMVVASYGGAGARLSPRDLYVSAMVGGLEMIRTGTTSVLDCARADLEWIDEGMDAIMQAYLDLGLRASVAIQFSDLDFFSSLPIDLVPGGAALRRPPSARPDEVLAAASRFLDRWEGTSPRVRPILGPSSLPRCSTELFGATVDLVRARGTRMQTHLLSARSQIDVARERFGGSTVEFLRKMGALEDWASFAHAIWLDEREVAMFAETDAVAVHNPASNLKLGAGVAPVPALLRAGARVALGSDGASSNDTQNMFETLKLSTIVHRVQGPPATWPTAIDGLTMCWTGGARALGADLGRIAVGALADLTVLDADHVWPAPAAQLRHQITYGELGSAVRKVYVDGAPVLVDGTVTTVDEAAIRAEARELTTRIWSSLPARLARFEEVRPTLERIEAASGVRATPSCG
ncbi:amidohydrolase family protein [Streptosporangium sp. NBC_01755]|uniref:amidohydrolase family protein n=1 Tax=unclassified Streptosporangium TaxID=2632669 RepID=UPI002DD7CC61|nr:MULTISPECIES: amidohydrolase family protein [unclassified Streptosporangium]WSA29015.1 amidohydrolase family protein [Streptosporangium sp. NBC_01810]WSC99538.1 amidohydrolase family protein [Streptosporangium sp. NBC_01755]